MKEEKKRNSRITLGYGSGFRPRKNENWSMNRKFARIVCTTPVDEACQGVRGNITEGLVRRRGGKKCFNEPGCYLEERLWAVSVFKRYVFLGGFGGNDVLA